MTPQEQKHLKREGTTMAVEDYFVSPDCEMETVQVVVFGDKGCFTPPQYKPENHTLPIINPTSARGVLDRIVLDTIEVEGERRPCMRNVVTRITAIEHPNARMRHRQNHIEQVMTNGVLSKAKIFGGYKPYDEETVQRSISVLHAPAFLVEAKIVILPILQRFPKKGKSLKSYLAMFNRRVKKGQTFKPISMGLKCFPGRIKMYEGEKPLENMTANLGPMLYDYVYDEERCRLLHRRYMRSASIQNGSVNCNWLSGDVELVEETEIRS